MLDPSVLSRAKRPDILELISLGRFQEIIQETGKNQEKLLSLLKFWKKDKAEKDYKFAYAILHACLQDNLDPINYSGIAELNFHKEFMEDVNELFLILLSLEAFGETLQYEQLISLTLLECIRDGAEYINKNSNNYPANPINANVWMNGASLRKSATELAEYFKRTNEAQHELDTLYLKCKVTTHIMGHYPNSVGPDMNAVALKLEELGNVESAKKFFIPVVLDFTNLISDIEQLFDEPELEDLSEAVITIESLIIALEGLKRLGETIDEDLLRRSKDKKNAIEVFLNEIKDSS